MRLLTKLRPTAIAAIRPIYSQTNENTHHRHNCRAIPRTLDSRLSTLASQLATRNSQPRNLELSPLSFPIVPI